MALHARSEKEIHCEHRSVLAKLRLNIEGELMPVAEDLSYFEPSLSTPALASLIWRRVEMAVY